MKLTNKFFLTLLFGLAVLPLQAQKFQELAQTPPMGWNSWNKFNCNVSEGMIRDMADAMVATGLKDAGYEYIVIDDCWHGERDSLGFITANPEHFPSGIKALAEYIHAKGLKFGIYSCAGNKTCAGKPASRGHEYQDALTYAQWGVDYLKYDWCDHEDLNAIGSYTTMSQALKSAGRPIVFSICEGGGNKPWIWAENVGHLWRTTTDIGSNFIGAPGSKEWHYLGVLEILDLQDGLRMYAGPGHWNDPDMLEVGNGMSVNEDRAHFTMWCMLAAPLMAGNDLKNTTTETLKILSNKEVIAIDQDMLGIQGFKYATKDSVETWLKPLNNGEWAVCFLNRSLFPKSVNMDWKTFFVKDALSGRELNTTGKESYKVRNLWLKKNIGDTRKSFKATVPAHDVLCLKLSK